MNRWSTLRMRTLNLYLLAMFLTMMVAFTSGCPETAPVVENPVWHIGNIDASPLCGTWETPAVGSILTDGAWGYAEASMTLKLRILGYVPGSYQSIGDDDDSAATEWVETGRYIGVITFENGCFYSDFEEEIQYICPGEDDGFDLSGYGYNAYYQTEGAVTYDEEGDQFTFIGAWESSTFVTVGELTSTGTWLWNFNDGISPFGRISDMDVDWGWQEFTYTAVYNVNDLNFFTDIEDAVTIGSTSVTVGQSYTACEL